MKVTTHNGKQFALERENDADDQLLDALDLHRAAYLETTKRQFTGDNHDKGWRNSAALVRVDAGNAGALRAKAASQALSALAEAFLTTRVEHDLDGFSLALTCQVSAEAHARELQALSAQGQNACTPESVRQTMLDRLALEARRALQEASPRLLACLVAVACEHQSEVNHAIVTQGGVA